MFIPETLLMELFVTLTGIFLGTLAAFGVDRFNEKQKKKKMAQIILHSLKKELTENYNILRTVMDEYVHTPWGKSFYPSTISWETAIASGDLPDIIGFELTDAISLQYSLFYKSRYYVDLLTKLWFAPETIPGYAKKREGFNTAILESLRSAEFRHRELMAQIEGSLR